MSFIKRPARPKGKRFLLSCGILLGLSAPGYGLWPLAWFMLIPVFRCLQAQPKAWDAWTGAYAFGAAFHLTWMAWLLGLHPLTWLGFNEVGSLLVSIAAWLTAGVLYGGLTSLILLLYWRMTRLSGKPRWLALALFPLFWVLGFNLLQYWALGVPWAYLEYTQHSVPWLRDLAGLAGTSSIIGGLLVLHNLLWAHVQPRSGLTRYGLPLLAPALLGLSLLLPESPPTQKLPVPVALVQGNLGIDVIRAGGLSNALIERIYLSELQQAALSPHTLVVLPEEGAINGLVSLQRPRQNPSAKALEDLAQQRNLQVLAGTVAVAPKQVWNALMLLPGLPNEAVQFYAKRKLVPFGEFTPYLDGEWISGILANFGAGYIGSFNAGTESRLLEGRNATGGPLRIGGLICFELIYPELAARYRAQGGDILVNVSNLGWFHGHPLLEQQFLAIGQLRAAETHLPLVISNNTGISAIIAPDGRILKQTAPRQQARLFLPE